MRRYRLLFLLLSIIALGAYSCTHKQENPVPGNGNTGGGNTGGGNNGGGNNGGGNNGGTPPDTGLCFQRDILPIFISNCAKSGCHDAASHKEGFVFTSWETITSKEFEPGDPDETELYETITENDPDKRMPLYPNAPLTAQQIGLIREWILRGAPNTTNCSTGCDSTRFAFSADIRPILETNCKGCHNTAFASAGFSYDTHAGVVTAVNSGRFLGAIKHQPSYSAMPKGGVKLSDCQIMKIEKWISAGKPDN